MARGDHTMLDLDGREVRFSNPGKVFFPERGYTKLDLCEYYQSVADACLARLRDRPTTMKRFTERRSRRPGALARASHCAKR